MAGWTRERDLLRRGDGGGRGGPADRDGYAARVVRERLAGEDDDEDHPWAVLTDAPEMVLELLVDEYDGWLDPDDRPDRDAGSPTECAAARPADRAAADQAAGSVGDSLGWRT